MTTHPIRVISRLDIKGPNVVKGIQFDGYRVLGTADQFAEIYYREGADELIYQDVVASLYRRNSLLEIVQATAEKIFIPLTVAGGLRSLEDIRKILRAGADKVAINTAATERPELLSDAAKVFGSQCIVSSIEAFRTRHGKYQVWVDYGRQLTHLDAIEWARRVEDLGVGEILITSINNEGGGRGYDLELISRIAPHVGIPVIACGGVGCKEHFVEGVEAGADAVAAASVFHYQYAEYQRYSPEEIKERYRLRMGQHVDVGNIDFLVSGYGGMRSIPVEPVGVGEAKKHLLSRGVTVRPVREVAA